MNSVKKYSQHIKNLLSQAGFSPRVDWIIALKVFALLLICIALSSVFVFVQLSRDFVDDSTKEVTEVKTIDRDTLKKVAQYFRERPTTATPDDSVLVDPSR